MKVLIVDDNPVNAEMIRHTLEKEGYQSVVAKDGEDALAQLDAHPDVALVVTDIMMPGIDGLEMIGRMRQRQEHKSLPVVVATSLANEKTVRKAVSLHCKHFIVKPFTVPVLVQAVRAAIGMHGVVLQSKAQALRRLGIADDGYDRLALTFGSFVRERVTMLHELSQRESHDDVDPTVRRDLVALEESATLLGAERLANLLASLGLSGGTVPAAEIGGAYKALLAELRRLDDLLPKAKAETAGDAPAAPSDAAPS